MLKVKTKYLNQKPPHGKIMLGEFTQEQLSRLPEHLINEYCEKVKKAKGKK